MKKLTEKLIRLGNRDSETRNILCLEGTVVAFNIKTLGTDGQGRYVQKYKDRLIDCALKLQSKGAHIVLYGKCSQEFATSESRLEKK